MFEEDSDDGLDLIGQPDAPSPNVGQPNNLDEQGTKLALATLNDGEDYLSKEEEATKAVVSGEAWDWRNEVSRSEKSESLEATRLALTREAAAGNVQAAAVLAESSRVQHEELWANASRPDSLEDTNARALQNAAALSGKPVNTVEGDDAVRVAARDMTLRDSLEYAVAKQGEKGVLLDASLYVMASFLPGFTNVYEWKANQVMKKLAGISDMNMSDAFFGGETRDQMFNWLGHLSSEERAALLQKIVNMDPKEFGIFGGNKFNQQIALMRLVEYEPWERALDAAGNLFLPADILASISILNKIRRTGAAARAANKGVGGEAAGAAIARDFLKGRSSSGLTTDELPEALMSIAKQMEDDLMKRLEGASAKAQQVLIEESRAALVDAYATLRSTARTPEELARGIQEIKLRYTSDTDPSIHSVKFDDEIKGETLGVEVRHGTYDSEAEAWRKAQINGWEGQPKRVSELDTPPPAPKEPKPRIKLRSLMERAQRAYRGTGEVWKKFSLPEYEGELGFGISVSRRKEIAEMFALKNGKRTGKSWLAEVEIPEDEHFLHYGKKFSEQGEPVKAALRKLLPNDPLLESYEDGMAIKVALEAAHWELSGRHIADVMKKAGIKGVMNESPRYGGQLGATFPEHLVFDPKEVRIKAWRNVERKPGKPIEPEDVAADEFMASLYKKDGQIGEAYEKPHLERLEEVYNHDNDLMKAARLIKELEGEPADTIKLAQRGTKFWGESISAGEARTITGWAKILGMGDTNINVASNYEDIVRLLRATGKDQDEIARILMRVKKENGMFMSFMGDRGPIYAILQKQTRLGMVEKLSTWAHELGHVFDMEVFSRMPLPVRRLIQRAHHEWLRKMDKLDYKGIAREFRAVTDESAKLFESGLLDRGYSPAKLDWYRDFSEFFAEQVSKWMLTDARPVGVLEQFFVDIAKRLKALFLDMAKKFGLKSQPEESVKLIMDNYLKGKYNTVMEPHSTGIMGTMRTELEQAKPRLRGRPATMEPKTPAAKPHIKAKARFPAEKWVFVEKRREVPTYDSIGKYDKEDIESMPTFAIDPKHAASENAVASRVVGVHAEAKVFTALRNYLDTFFKGLSRGSKKKVEAVLAEGDAASDIGGVGKEFSYGELMVKGLNEKEAMAYFAARSARNTTYMLRNAEMVRHLKARGFQQVQFPGNEGTWAGRVLKSGEKPDADMVWDVEKNMAVPVDEIDFTTETRRVVQLDGERKMPNGKEYSVFVGAEDSIGVSDLKKVLNQRPGEFSRIYSDEYFIVAKRAVEVDGKLVDRMVTIRTAASAKEATKYVDDVSAAIKELEDSKDTGITQAVHDAVSERIGKYYDDVDAFINDWREGDLKDAKEVYWHYDRQAERFIQGQVDAAKFDGRLFTSKRGEKIHSVDRQRQNTLSPLESLQAEVNNISKFVSIKEWRETQIKKWMNTFGHLVARSGDWSLDFHKFNPSSLPKTDKEHLFAKRTHAYIMRQIGAPTNEDKWFDAVKRVASEQILDNVPFVGTWMGARVRNMQPINFIRSINFDFNLGAFNPAQLIVQSNGAATAMFLHPVYGAKAAALQPLVRMALMSDRPDVWRKVYKANVGGIGATEEEFVELVAALNRSGLIRNTKSTALWNKEAGKLGIDWRDVVPAKVRRNHTFFFDRGEEFSRIVAFDVARREWKAANAGKKMDDAAIKWIIEKADDYTQNMTKANLARWQEGVMSIPLQFAQYNIKLALNIMSGLISDSGKHGRSFTKAQAATLLAQHAVWYGASGLGIASILDEILPEEAAASMSEEEKLAASQGMLAWLINEVSGAKVNMGERLGAASYGHQMYDLIVNRGNIFDVMLGPTAGSAKRIGAIGDVLSLWRANPDLSAEDVLDGVREITFEQVSTLRNATKAYVMYNMDMHAVNKRGQKMAPVNMSEIVAQALGFSPVAMGDVYGMIKSRKDHEEALWELSELIMKQQLAWAQAIDAGNKEKADRIQKLIWALYPANYGDMQIVLNNMKERTFPFSNQLEKEMSKHILRPTSQKMPLTITTTERKK